MNNNNFFNKTNVYKEYVILDYITTNNNFTQRDIARATSSSVSMINLYLNEYENKGYIKKEVITPKRIKYNITTLGIKRKRFLNIGYLNEAFEVYNHARKEVLDFIDEMKSKNIRDVIFYGAGDVCNVLLDTIVTLKEKDFKVAGIIDDDINKQNTYIYDYLISSNEIINNVKYDALLITSYSKQKEIEDKLKKLNYHSNKIIYFFK